MTHKPSEDQLARELEKAHERLLNNDNSNRAVNDSGELPELDSARQILKLIDQVKGQPSGSTAKHSQLTATIKNPEVDSASPLNVDEQLEFVLKNETRTIGRFKNLERLGQGGFGLVFRAFDPKLDREVAIKIPRPETLFDPDLRKRFTREAKAAASLSHPNIVSVYETGNHGSIHFLVNELIRGKTLADWLGRRVEPVTPVAAANLVAVLADALQHAHSRKVLHRDIKPSNILLENPGENELSEDRLAENARISDFGLAKFQHDDSDQTKTGALVGTPTYMSPEQAAGSNAKVGATTDIYSLGAVLYELLTGRKVFVATTVIETIRQVQNSEPTPPRSIRPGIPRDLESICLKCLEKKPEARYRTAFELAEDLRNFRNGLPVTASPVTNADRLIRWTSRNPALAVVGSVATLALLFGLAATAIGWSSTTRALASEQKAKLQAEQRYRDFKGAVDTYFNEVCDNPLIKQLPQSAPLRKELLHLALSYYQKFAEENLDDQDLPLKLAQTYNQIGAIFSDLGRPSEALVQFSRALEQLDAVEDWNADDNDALQTRAKALDGKALALIHLGDTETAAPLETEAIAIQSTLVKRTNATLEDRQQLATYQSHFGFLLSQQNDFENALEAYQSTIELCSELTDENPDDRNLELQKLRAIREGGNTLIKLGRIEDAETEIDASVFQLKDLIFREPALWEAAEILAETLSRQAEFRLVERDPKRAEPLLVEALPITKTLCLVSPHDADYFRLQNRILQMLSATYMQMKLHEKAAPLFEKSVDVAEKIHSFDPDATEGISNVAISRMNYGNFLASSKAFDEAETQFRKSREYWRQLETMTQNPLQTQRGLAGCSTNLSRLIRKRGGNIDESFQYADEAVKILDSLQLKFPNHLHVKSSTFTAYGQRANALRDLNRFTESISDFRKRLKLAPPPKIPEVHVQLALSLMEDGQTEEAFQLMTLTKEGLEQAPRHQHQKLYLHLAECYAVAASSLETDSSSNTEYDSASRQHIETALDCLRKAIAEPGDPERLREIEDEENLEILHDLPEFLEILDSIKRLQ